MDSRRLPRVSRPMGIRACILLLIASAVGVEAGAEGERIVLRSADAAQLEQIRASLEATPVRTLRGGSQVWELPGGTRADALARLREDDRIDYVAPFDGDERSLFADRSVTHDLTPDQTERLAQLQQRPTTGTLHTAALHPGRFAADLLDSSTADEAPIHLDLLPGQRFEARARRVQARDEGLTWYGTLADRGQATLVLRGEQVTGQVDAAGKRFSIRPLGGGLHAIYEVKQEKFPPEHRPEFHDEIPPKSAAELPQPSASPPTADSPIPRVDVMVVYPSSLASGAVDLAGEVQLAIDLTNQSYENSEVRATVNLVHHQALDYEATGQTGSDLAALVSAAEPGLESIASLRDAHGADVVLMLLEEGADFCGEAADIPADDASAFAVVSADCASANLSFAHELGHLLGARHDVDADPETEPFKHGHGHFVGRVSNDESPHVGTGEDSLWGWLTGLFTPDDPEESEDVTEHATEAQPAKARTIMAYAKGCGFCDRIPYWSNPNLQYDGHSLGTAELEDNARVLSYMAPFVADFRSPNGQ